MWWLIAGAVVVFLVFSGIVLWVTFTGPEV